jgi:hypothetical protein
MREGRDLRRSRRHHPQLTRKVSPAETEQAIGRRLQFISRFIGNDTTYLEVGPGDCALTFEVAKRVRKSIGIDVSAEVTSSHRRGDNLELILSDGTSIPVPPGSLVSCAGCLITPAWSR